MSETNTYPGESADAIGDDVAVLLVDDDETWLSSTAEILEHQREAFAVQTATDLESAERAYADGAFDCLVCDYDLGAHTGLELLSTVRDDDDRPFILITGQGNESVASAAISRQVTDYIPKRSLSGRSDLLARRVESAVGRYRTERALARERRNKDAMLDILTATASRDGITRAFCDHLVSEEAYDCAWIGTDGDDDTLVPRASAGTESYLDAALPPADAEEGTEPALVARSRNEVAVATDMEGDRRWQRAARDHGFETAIAAPIRHEGSVFGALAVYKRTGGVAPEETQLLEAYGETIGYALRSATWRESLLSGSPVTVELAFRTERYPLVAVDRQLPEDAKCTLLTTVPRAETVLYLLRVDSVTAAAVTDAVDGVDAVTACSVTQSEGPVRCELTVQRPTPETVITEAGGRVVETAVDGGTATVVAARDDNAGIQSVVDAVSKAYPDSTVGAVRSDGPGRPTATDVLDALTEKQRRALELAYFNGYFQRPREHDTTEVAEKFGVSRQTLTQHLRSGHRKLLGALFDDAAGDSE